MHHCMKNRLLMLLLLITIYSISITVLVLQYNTIANVTSLVTILLIIINQPLSYYMDGWSDSGADSIVVVFYSIILYIISLYSLCD